MIHDTNVDMHCLKFVSVLLAVLLSGVLPTPALPAVRTFLQKNTGTSNDFERIEDDEPLYAYVYDYEGNGDQIWSDCSKLTYCYILYCNFSSVGVSMLQYVCHKLII